MTDAAPDLLIDAGNSRIKWALVRADGAQIAAGVVSHEEPRGEGNPGDGRRAIADVGGRADGDIGDNAPHIWADLPVPRAAWMSNVAGAAVAARIAALLDAQWPGLPLTTIRACPQQCGVNNSYTTPGALGSDRWAGMIGAHAAFPGENLLIATFGTATTLEALRADGCFVGGLIAPGWTLMMRSLGEHTAQLPTLDASAARGLIGVSGSGTPGDTGIGKGNTNTNTNTSGHAATTRRGPFFSTDTPRSLSAGCTLAQAGLIERMWRDLQDEWQVPVRLVVSGGAVDEVASALKVPHTRHDSLVLSGLALIAAEQRVERGASAGSETERG